MQELGASDLHDGAGYFKSTIEADEEVRFKVEGELKQLSALPINHHTLILKKVNFLEVILFCFRNHCSHMVSKNPGRNSSFFTESFG